MNFFRCSAFIAVNLTLDKLIYFGVKLLQLVLRLKIEMIQLKTSQKIKTGNFHSC